MDRARQAILAEPLDACNSDMCDKDVCKGKVVLVRRGGCSFYKKALNIMRGSDGLVSAILIYDTAETTNGWPITMTRGADPKHDTERWAGVPVLSLLKKDGETIAHSIQSGAEPSLSIHFNREDWIHSENEYAIRQQLLNPSQQSSHELWHNLGASISSASPYRYQDAIDALETSASIKPTEENLNTLGKLYYNEAMYLGMAITRCRQIAFMRDAKEIHEARDQAQSDFRATAVGNTHPSGRAAEDHICERVTHMEEKRRTLLPHEKFDTFFHVPVEANAQFDAKAS